MARNRKSLARRTWPVKWLPGETLYVTSDVPPRANLGLALCAAMEDLGLGELLAWMVAACDRTLLAGPPPGPPVLHKAWRDLLVTCFGWFDDDDDALLAALGDHGTAVLVGVLYAQTPAVRHRIRQAAGLCG